MKVIFSHGKESGPWGSKIRRLAYIAREHGFEVDSIDYSGMDDPELRVKKLRAILVNENLDELILVGSSMGGYVSLSALDSQLPKALFLLAPALYMPNYNIPNNDFSDSLIEIVHGWSDNIIPVEHSIKFAQQYHHTLHLIDGDHRLNSSKDIVASLFTRFLAQVKSQE